MTVKILAEIPRRLNYWFLRGQMGSTRGNLSNSDLHRPTTDGESYVPSLTNGYTSKS